MGSLRWVVFSVALLLGAALFAGCGGRMPSGGPFVWLDVPVDGVSLPEGQPVNIEGHAAYQAGLDRVELWVNAERQAELSDLATVDDLTRFTFSWLPPGPGEYTLQVISYGADGATSEPDSARITIGTVAAALPDLTVLSVEVVVAGEKDGVPFCNTRLVYQNVGSAAVPGAFSIRFTFDGVEALSQEFAGGLPAGATQEATFVYQFIEEHTLGISLDSGGAISESNEANNDFSAVRRCGVAVTPAPPTVTPTFSATCPPQVTALQSVNCRVGPGVDYEAVGALAQGQSATVLGSNADRSWWLVESSGGGKCWVWGQPVQLSSNECQVPVVEAPPLPSITPTSIQQGDTTPPPAPGLQVPNDGLEISCKSSQTLAWLPVQDPSGIASYQVDVWRHSGDNIWKPVSGSPFVVYDKQGPLQVECGWTYRWRVRAMDGAGNAGPWSGWWTFVITLQ